MSASSQQIRWPRPKGACHASLVIAGVWSQRRRQFVMSRRGDRLLITGSPATLDRSRNGSHVQIDHLERVLLDELAPRLDHVAHERREDVPGLVRLLDRDLEQRALGGV